MLWNNPPASGLPQQATELSAEGAAALIELDNLSAEDAAVMIELDNLSAEDAEDAEFCWPVGWTFMSTVPEPNPQERDE